MVNTFMDEFKKVIIYSHNTGGDGHYDDELFSYFLKEKFIEIIKIDFPFGEKSVKTIRFKYYKNQKEIFKFKSIFKFSTPTILSYVKDSMVGLYYGFKFARGTDLFVGMDNLLAFVGLILKKFGIVKKVYCVVIDYMPIRYNNIILNYIYYSLDKYVLYTADMVFSLNDKIIQSRIKDKKYKSDKIKYFITPFGNHSLNRKKEDYEHNSKNTIVYFGGVIKDKGSELFVPIVKSLIGKGFNDFKFLIIGGGDIDLLKKEVNENNLDRYFEITGRIDSHIELENLLLKSTIALAPYYPEDKNNISYYSDVGKVKVYLGCGLPIVITDVPPVAKYIESSKVGLISKYEADNFAHSIMRILNSYDNYHKNAIITGKEFDWNIIFDRYFKGNTNL